MIFYFLISYFIYNYLITFITKPTRTQDMDTAAPAAPAAPAGPGEPAPEPDNIGDQAVILLTQIAIACNNLSNLAARSRFLPVEDIDDVQMHIFEVITHLRSRIVDPLRIYSEAQ